VAAEVVLVLLLFVQIVAFVVAFSLCY
jgi:hypothetical protein